MRPSYLPHAVLSRSILRLSFVTLSQHLLYWCKPWCPEKCSRSGSINIWQAPRVNDDTLSARHYITECIYSISPGTKVLGSGARHHRWQIRQPAVLSKLRSSAQGLLRLLSATTTKSYRKLNRPTKGVHIKMMSASRKRVVFLEKQPGFSIEALNCCCSRGCVYKNGRLLVCNRP